MCWLSQSYFQNSYYGVGAGACLQPLLRNTDNFSTFLFIEFDVRLDDVIKSFQKSITEFQELAAQKGQVAPLQLESIDAQACLCPSDFDLALAPADAMNAVNGLLSTAQRAEYKNTFAVNADQWGVQFMLTRMIVHVDGAVETRPIELRVAGGEGIVAYIGMGGLNRAPRYVESVQTGIAEHHQGPIAKLFARQAEENQSLPDVWVRGTRRDARHHAPLRPASPFIHVGQSYPNWQGDRAWPNAPDRRRYVTAWMRGAPASAVVEIGQHRIYSAPIDQSVIEAADTACLPANLAERLGVGHLSTVSVIERPDTILSAPLGEILSGWQCTNAFQNANDGVLVPTGYEDELSVLVAWLRRLTRPRMVVYLPCALDFAAAERALHV